MTLEWRWQPGGEWGVSRRWRLLLTEEMYPVSRRFLDEHACAWVAPAVDTSLRSEASGADAIVVRALGATAPREGTEPRLTPGYAAAVADRESLWPAADARRRAVPMRRVGPLEPSSSAQRPIAGVHAG